jgi:undecaprenyl phosphate-alpha-L-ara4N flippase subunit ArnE
LLVVLSQLSLVSGQVFLKHGMSLTNQNPKPTKWITGHLTAGIGLLTLWFFVWMGLLQKLQVSYLFPFEGMSPILLVVAAWLVLGEEMAWRTWLGAGLIAVGTALVGFS